MNNSVLTKSSTSMTATDAVPKYMQAVVLAAPKVVEIRESPVPALRSGHVLVRTAYVGLCGADAAMWDGSSVYLRQGLKAYPFVFGHEWSGVVAAVADDVKNVLPGERVVGHNFITCEVCPACRSGRRTHCSSRSEMGILGDYPGAASEYALVPAKVLASLPDAVTLRDAALLEPASTALHAVTRVNVKNDDRVVVFGTGAVGLHAAQIAAGRGAAVDVVGIDDAGLQLALDLGAKRALRPEQAPNDFYNVAIEASGAPSAVSQAARAITYGGRLAIVGIAHHPVNDFPWAELTIRDANVQAVLSGIDFWDQLVDLAARGPLQLSPLLDRVIPFARAAEAFELQVQPRSKPKLLLQFFDPEAEAQGQE